MIGLRADLGGEPVPEAALRLTLIHEWLHVLLHNTGLQDDVHEALVTQLAPTLLDGLRENPQLVLYLMESP